MSEDLHKILEELIKEEATIAEESYNLFHLLQEMTQITDDFIIWIIGYCDKHNIPIWNEKQLGDYSKMSKKLLRETEEKISNLQELIQSRQLPRHSFHRRSPEDLPEPFVRKF